MRTIPDNPTLGKMPTLLCLPGELRNRIYKYVLTTPNANALRIDMQWTKASKRKPKLYEVVEPYEEFNRMKYVCHQLYQETAGLEAKFNTIIFRNNFSTEQFLEFRDTCSSERCAWLSSVVLKGRMERARGLYQSYLPWSPKVLCRLLDICRQFPHLHIRLVVSPAFRDFNSMNAPSEFITRGTILNLALRGVWLGHLWTWSPLNQFLQPSIEENTRRTIEKWRQGEDISEVFQHPNLSVWPAECKFEVDRFWGGRFTHEVLWKQRNEIWMEKGFLAD